MTPVTPLSESLKTQISACLATAGQLPDVTMIVVERDLTIVGIGGASKPGSSWLPEDAVGRRLDELMPSSLAQTTLPQVRAAFAGDAPVYSGPITAAGAFTATSDAVP